MRVTFHDTCLDCAMNYLHLMDLAIAHRRAPTPPDHPAEHAAATVAAGSSETEESSQ